MSFSPLQPPLIVTGSTITRPANTTAYAFGNLVANSTTAGSVVPSTIAAARANDVPGTILRARLLTSSTSVANALFRLHLYNQLPTFSNGDGAAWLTTSAGYISSLDITVAYAFSDGAWGIGYPTIGSGINFNPVSGTQNIYCVIEARNAYTPTSGEVFTPVLEVQ